MNPLPEIIRREIRAAGAISFARFMALALYCPQLGYYERKPDTVGRRGDYYTSVSVGPLFGELLAFQFAEWLEAEVRSQKSEVRIIEAGAHDGKLAADILDWLQKNRQPLYARLEYSILEPSPQRQQWQRENLARFAPRVRWLSGLSENQETFSGVLFSNELLDAFPVQRLGWDARAKQWFEWGVAVEGERFVWTRLPVSAPSSIFHPPSSPDLLEVLPDGYTIEICPAAAAWWREAAAAMRSGKLVAIDYGLTAAELFLPERPGGTLRAYHQHQISDDLLANAGEQDLTAHVNFSSIQQAGEAAGLQTEGLFAQPKFLTDIAARVWKNPAAFGEWTPARTRQFQTLTHPQHLGRAFRVLVQSRPA
ncbi:MAG: SAM-dependent methyltransferase [Verrucomicrobia bacterium]|nr:SAM-dependent methyltransferase [Verrucomicrobiota bacterium]